MRIGTTEVEDENKKLGPDISTHREQLDENRVCELLTLRVAGPIILFPVPEDLVKAR